MTIQIETESGIILPGHPFFDDWLYSSLPPSWRDFAFHNPDFAFVTRADTGLLEAVSAEETAEYIEGGEYDQLMEGKEDDDDFY